jgi:hypothetical protein
MKFNLDTAAVATALVLIYALVGAVLVVLSAIGHVDPAMRLSFASYLAQMAIAVAGLAVGRGLAANSTKRR